MVVKRAGIMISFDRVPLDLRIENALVSYAVYLWKLIWPADLVFFYMFPKSIPMWQPLGAFVTLVGITLLVVIMGSPGRKRYLATGWFWFAGVLFPTIGIVQAGLWPALADRWVYLPYIGLYVAVIWGIGDLVSKRKHGLYLLRGAAVGVIVVFGVITFRQTAPWKNDLSLFSHAVQLDDTNHIIREYLGK